MANNVVVFEQLLLQVLRNVVVCSACIGIFRIPARALGRQFVRSQETVTRSSGIERAVNVEERVALSSISAKLRSLPKW